MYLEINPSKNKKFSKMKFLKEQDSKKNDASSDNEDLFLTAFSSASKAKQSFCDYLVVYDFEEDE